MSSDARRPTFMERAALAASVVVAGLAVLRMLVVLVPMAWFDTDPVLAPTPAGWGPAHMLALDALTLALAGFVYAVCMVRARAADALMACAVLVPAVVVVWHGAHSADDAWRGAGWLAAMVAGGALWTATRVLPRGGALRGAVIAVLLAAAGPLLARSAFQWWVEHAATVEQYKHTREAFLAARGWAADSAQALMYERRLFQREATGWFGLSNLLSSVLAAVAIACAGLAIAGRRTLEAGTVALLGGVGAACMAVVIANGSRGAIGAACIGTAVALVALGAGRALPGRFPRAALFAGSMAGVCAVAAAVAAVVARGMAGEAWGERSLLFRWHYMQGAVKAWLVEPLAGVGPAGFGSAYLLTRPDRAPEEVLSAHSMWADWLAALGMGALPWVAVVLAWVWLAGRPGGAESGAPASLGRRFMMVALGVVCVVAVGGMAVEMPLLDGAAILARCIGVACALVLVVAVVQALETPTRGAAAALCGAAVALAVHAQIEMTLWNPGSVGWVVAFIAVVGAQPVSDAPRGACTAARRTLVRCVVGVAALASVALSTVALLRGAVPAAIDNRQMARAAEVLTNASTLTAGAPLAPPAHGAPPARIAPAVRAEAARLLAAPGALMPPWANRPARLAAGLEQWALALESLPATDPAFDALVPHALVAAQAAVDRAPTEGVLGAAQAVGLQAARSTTVDLAAAANRAVEEWASMHIDRSPRSVGAWVRMAIALGAQGHADAARAAYRQALMVDDSYALDPIRQLAPAERAEIERRAGVR